MKKMVIFWMVLMLVAAVGGMGCETDGDGKLGKTELTYYETINAKVENLLVEFNNVIEYGGTQELTGMETAIGNMKEIAVEIKSIKAPEVFTEAHSVLLEGIVLFEELVDDLIPAFMSFDFIKLEELSGMANQAGELIGKGIGMVEVKALEIDPELESKVSKLISGE